MPGDAIIVEQGVQEGTEHATLRVSIVVLLPNLTTWGWPVRKSRTQLQMEVFSPRVLSLVMSLEGTMVLNAELLSMNSILTYVLLLARWERVVWSAIEIASSVERLGRYVNWSGSWVSGMMVL